MTRIGRWISAAILSTGIAGAVLAKEDKHVGRVGDLKILHVWTRATSSLSQPVDIFLEIENARNADQLVGAASDIAAKAAIVGLSYKPGTVAFLESAEVPARGQLVLEPDGIAIRLEGLKQPLKQGQDFQIRLTFQNAGSVMVTGEVMAANARRHGHAGHGH